MMNGICNHFIIARQAMGTNEDFDEIKQVGV